MIRPLNPFGLNIVVYVHVISLITSKDSKTNRVMMSPVRNRLNLVKQCCDYDGMKKDGVDCLNDSEPY